MKLSILLPVYGETELVRQTVKDILKSIGEYVFEILIIISPKSNRESFDVCYQLEKLDSRVKVHIQRQNPGLGYAYREGFEVFNGTHLAVMASDGETPVEVLKDMISKSESSGADVVVASRWLESGGFGGYNPIKYLVNLLFQRFFSVLFRTRLTDLTYGYKIMSREVVESIKWISTTHEICTETTLIPLIKGYRIEEVPARWIARKEGKSRNTFRNNLRYIIMALKVLFRRRV